MARVLLLLGLVVGVVAAEGLALGKREAFRLATGWSPVPSGATLRRLSFGYDRAMADVLWLRSLQYYGAQRLARAPMPRLLDHINSTVTLDPRFISPYVFGALVLAQDLGQSDAAVDLLLRGIAANPERWELPFELGFLFYIHLGEPELGARYFELASGRKGCPEMARRLAAWAYARSGSRANARRICREIVRQSDDPTMRTFAEQALMRIDIEESLEILRAAIDGYRLRVGEYPPSLGTLVQAGILARVPEEPGGGFYAYRPETGEVRSSSGLQRELEEHLGTLRDAIARYRGRRGAYPPRLESLVAERLVDEVRSIFGFEFAYDPDSGRVWLFDPRRT